MFLGQVRVKEDKCIKEKVQVGNRSRSKERNESRINGQQAELKRRKKRDEKFE